MRTHVCVSIAAMMLILVAGACDPGQGTDNGTDNTTTTSVPENAISVRDLQGADDIDPGAVFLFSFTEPVDTETVTERSFYLLESALPGPEGSMPPDAPGGSRRGDMGGNPLDNDFFDPDYAVAASVACSSDTDCTLTPDEPLQYNMRYTVCLTPDITFASGQSMMPAIAVFTTATLQGAFTEPYPETLGFKVCNDLNANAGFAIGATACLVRWLPAGTIYALEDETFVERFRATDTLGLLQTFSTEVLNGQVHFIGGLKDDGNLCEVPGGGMYNCATSETWIYTPGEGILEPGPPINNARDVAASGVVDGRIYLIGGWNPNPESANLASVEVCDGTSWQEIDYTGRFEPVRSPAFAVAGEKIYIIGGCLEKQGCQQTLLQVFDTRTHRFSRGADLIRAGRHFSGQHAVTRQDRYIYVYGGATDMSETKFDDVAVYDTVANEWRALEETLTAARKSVGSVMVGDTLYVSGGGQNSTEIGTFSSVGPQPAQVP